MSKKLITQYHVLNSELSTVVLDNTKYIKLLYHNNKLFWKIKARFLFLIYLHLNLNCIEVIVVLLPSYDVIFNKRNTKLDTKIDKNSEKSENVSPFSQSMDTHDLQHRFVVFVFLLSSCAFLLLLFICLFLYCDVFCSF